MVLCSPTLAQCLCQGISICSDWGSIEDIVKKSGKSTSYIRNVVIPLLLAEKSIVMLFPGTPRNPNQKYRIKE